MGYVVILSIFCVPVLAIALALFSFSTAAYLWLSISVSFVLLVSTGYILSFIFTNGPLLLFNNLFYLDLLSVFHMVLVASVFFIASLYAYGYFIHEIAHDPSITKKRMSRFTMLWNGFLGAMMLVLVSNNIGLQWVALESTTLVSAFLILFDGGRKSIEAMWKYLLVCSVGIAFALVAVILVSVASTQLNASNQNTLLWTDLMQRADELNPIVMLAAFIFAFIGFGTKAGLAPMHTWLPDAHSQAPTPVSSVFSGVMLSCAFYGILRYLPLTERAMHTSDVRQILILFGLFSMSIAAFFIMFQHDVKRLLAYSSIEHIGIISVGMGLGGIGVYAALLHTAGHALTKSLAFCSAGRIVQTYETRQINKIQGSIAGCPVWGFALFATLLVLIGVAPGILFVTELQILFQSIKESRYVIALVFAVSCSIVFIALLRHGINVTFGNPQAQLMHIKPSVREIVLVIVVLTIVCCSGIWIPESFKQMIHTIATIIGNTKL